MRKTAYHHGDLKNALYKACHRLLKQKDPKEISLRSVAEIAGTSHAAIYRHFKDKDELLEVMAAFGFEKLANAQKKAFEKIKHPKEGFVALGLAYIKFAVSNPSYYKLMFQTKRTKVSLNLRRSQIRSYSVLLHSCKVYLDSVGKKTNPKEYAMMAWSLVHGYSNLVIETDFPKTEAGSMKKPVLVLAEDILRRSVDL
ncbi:TetR/AcrR family transcriptional regulator [Leptospira idonii]|uniref:TetR/AcrR family transcriptional regulator n=1 Tax=Leptospira idonii TaxID=1193500 RepID=A0A4R9M6B3_9LEPT|nr:TetR/AcrR family transcriptional regulator [Leptospira idonii]TGN20228.1 TetR/AcrR family transcriptional regulator [Leptospira idonii]